jgi:hypothetical protein
MFSRLNIWFAAPLAAGIISAALYLGQGGYTLGHTDIDQVLGFLLTPGLYSLPVLRLVTDSLSNSKPVDFLVVVVVPTMINIGLMMTAK